MGWETEEEARRPFLPGPITNGLPPADYEVVLVEPGPDAPVVLAPGEPCAFVVDVRVLEPDSPNADIPPSFVFVKFARGNGMAGGDWLKPSAMGPGSFTYSGQIPAPRTVGDYDIVVETKHSVLDLSTLDDEGSSFSFGITSGERGDGRLFQKVLRGPTIHVEE